MVGAGTAVFFVASVECNYTATAAAGYQFDGWYNLSDEKVSDQATYTLEAQTSLTLVAKFQEETQHTHTVTLVKGTPATCTQPGVKDYYQCDCGAVFEDEAMTKPIEDLDTWKVIPALGHKTEVQGAKEATCTAEGYTGDQVCTVCGETRGEGPGHPHEGPPLRKRRVCGLRRQGHQLCGAHAQAHHRAHSRSHSGAPGEPEARDHRQAPGYGGSR